MGSLFHEMSDEELAKQLEQFRGELREQRFNYAVVRSLQDPGKSRKLKRNIARILTVQSERVRGVATVRPKSEKAKKLVEKTAKNAAPAAEKKTAKSVEKAVKKEEKTKAPEAAAPEKTSKKAAKKTAAKSAKKKS
jgi:ribosomal protein L29